MLRWLLVVIVGVMFSGLVMAGDDVAIIKHVEGLVNINRSGEILIARPRDGLRSGDILITEESGLVGVIFHDGSVLSLEENSLLRITEFTFKPIEDIFHFELELEKGTTLFESGKIGTLAPEKFIFRVPEGTIGIRGTKFLVEVK